MPKKLSTDELMEDEAVAARVKGNSDGKEMPEHGADSHKIYALHHVANTMRDQLAEMSDIPPDLFRTLSVLRIHVDDVVAICEDIVKAQKIWQKNWEYWNLPAKATMDKLQQLAKKNGKIIIGEKHNVIAHEYPETFDSLVDKIRDGYHLVSAEISKPKKRNKIEKDIKTVVFACQKKGWTLVKSHVKTLHGSEIVYRSAKDELVRLEAIIAEKKYIDAQVVKWNEFIAKLKTGKTRLAADNFEYYYLQRRRSKEGLLLGRFMDAGQDQIAAEGANLSPEEMMNKLAEDKS
jgi:hypothetical protein